MHYCSNTKVGLGLLKHQKDTNPNCQSNLTELHLRTVLCAYEALSKCNIKNHVCSDIFSIKL